MMKDMNRAAMRIDELNERIRSLQSPEERIRSLEIQNEILKELLSTIDPMETIPPHHRTIVELAIDGLRGTDIAQQVKVSKATASRVLNKYGDLVENRGIPEEMVKPVAALYDAGILLSELSIIFKIEPHTLLQIIENSREETDD